MVQLRVLGVTILQKEDGSYDQSFLAGPKRLALLTYLLLKGRGGFMRRDRLVSLFWPEMGQHDARNALSNMLYHIRSELGRETLINRGNEEVGVDLSRIWCDALAFDRLVEEEQHREALELYKGELLQGFHVSEVSNTFQNWLDAERDRLRQKAAQSSWLLAEEELSGDNPEAARRWAVKAAGFEPFSEEVVARLIKFLDGLGYREDALKAYKKFDQRYRKEWQMEPSDELRQLVDSIRNKNRDSSFHGIIQRETRNGYTLGVLPFEALGDKETRFFSSSIHGDMLTRLSNISGLKVISRTSVKKYASTKKSAGQIGRELSATWLLEGEVQEHSGSVQLNVRLIHAQSDTQVWSKEYLNKMDADKFFEIQGEISRDIAEALKTRLTPQERSMLDRQPTESLGAYRLYMQGLSWVEQRTEKGTRRAMEYFEQALQKDPNFSLALAGYALALLALYGYGFDTSAGVLDRAEAYIYRALEQDAELAEGHVALGVLYNERRQGPEAERELRRAIDLRPGYANAHSKLSWLSQMLGKPKQALTSARKAVELDPFSPESVINLSFSHLINREPEQALLRVREVRVLQPDYVTAPFYEGLILYHQGRHEEALPLLEGLKVEWAPEGPELVYVLCRMAVDDYGKEAMEQLHFFEDQELYFGAGLIEAALGEVEKAVQLFRRVKKWEPWPSQSLHFLFQEVLGEIRKHPSFDKVMHQVRESWGMNREKAF